MKPLNYIGVIHLFFCFSSFAQPSPGKNITGKVTNERGESLAHANVTIKNGRGNVTNARGQFLLKNVTPNDILQISFVGYSSQTVAVKDQSVLNIVLKQAENELDKVVVQGYGITSDRLRTGSIEKITSEQISKQPVMNVLNVLQGQTPGAVVTNASGYASGTVKVEIRGRNTINPNFPSEPLYIIDGVPITILNIDGTNSYNGGTSGVIKTGTTSPASGQSPLFGINPSDVESIEVLKDADATAIYGSRASNGVILITTKKGKMGKTNFDLNIYQGIEKITTRYKVLNTEQYLKMRKEALTNDGLPVDINNAPDLVAWDINRNTDWQKFMFGGTGKTTQAIGTISGGNAQTTFRIGAGYQFQSDVLAVSGDNSRRSLSLNLNHKSQDQRFALSLSSMYSYTSVNIISTPANALLTPNAPPVYDAYGNLNYNGWMPLDYEYPFASLLQPYSTKTNFLNSHLGLNYQILKGLSIKADFGYNHSLNDQVTLKTIASFNPRNNPKGSAFFGSSVFHNLIVEPQIEYNTFIKQGKIGILAGGTIQSNDTSSTGQSGSGYTNDLLLTSINNAAVRNARSFKGEYKYASVFGRLSYNFKDEYILNINARRDGSSRFGPGRQYGNFAAIGGAWIFTEENWIRKNIRFLSFGKIRSSFGITGGDQIADYSFLSQWTFAGNNYNAINPLLVTKHTDSTLQWEVNKKMEVSLSLGFADDRISFEANWYRHRCNNQLVFFPLPGFTGFTQVTSNSPANVQNTGYEFTLNSKIIKATKLHWDLKFTYAQNRNKLISYPNFSQSPYVSQLSIGKSLNLIKLLHYTSVDPQTGYYQFEDKDKDGKITVDPTGSTPDDRYDFDRSVKFDGGLTNTISYKNFELSVYFYYRKQTGLNAFAFSSPPGGISNIPEEVYQNHWHKPGDVVKYARFTTNSGIDPSYTNFYFYSDGKFTDASFIRLQNLSFSYSFPEKLINKAKIKNCRFYIKGENLLLITRYKGSDPEIQNFGAIPISKIITAGFSCTF
jgi:TonB-linked SusC/RagA family outer membrane protein